MHPHLKRTNLALVLLAIIVILIFLRQIDRISRMRVAIIPDQQYDIPKSAIQCYRMKLESLPDISEITPRKGKSIFFHETSCRSFDEGKITINARQACCVESAAILNPNLDIYVLYSSPGIIKFEGNESDNFLEALLSYKNVKIMHLDYGKFTEGTPVEELYKSGKLEGSDYVVSHASDVIRYTTLWKYGGIYLDLDFLVLKTLENLTQNYAGLESKTTVNSALLSFDSDGIGHSLAEECLNELKYNFDGKLWAKNGPAVITKILLSTCDVNVTEKMSGKTCHGFTVYPEEHFHPIPYYSWKSLFDEEHSSDVIEKIRGAHTLHIWNYLSSSRKIPITSNASYTHLAREHCPKVVKAINTLF